MAKQLTVLGLIDYLSQFPGETLVFENSGDVPEDCEHFIALDTIAYEVDEEGEAR